MDTQNDRNDFDQQKHNGRIFAGLFVLLVGAAFLMRELSIPFIPDWLFTWPMILIVIGIYTGIKHEFRNPGWIILVVIGAVFMADEVDMGFNFHRFVAPIIIISAGLIMVFRPRRSCRNRQRDSRQNPNWVNPGQSQPFNTSASTTQAFSNTQNQQYTSQDFFDSTSVFGGVKKVIVSKDFRGGDITCFMGGCEVDLTQADMQSPAIIDVTQIFGGTKLIVPPHWQVRTEMTAIFGSVEDKRQQPLSPDTGKLLILKGTSIFGGIEIKNY